MSSAVGKLGENFSLTESFVDEHFTTIAFAVSSLALLILAPFELIFGSIIGFFIHSYSEPDLKLKRDDPIITVPNSAIAIIGSVAALIRMTPAGSLGGFVFQWIPFMSILTMGSTAYRFTRSI